MLLRKMEIPLLSQERKSEWRFAAFNIILLTKYFVYLKIPLILHRENTAGAVVQLVRISACHAGGRGFESRPHRKKSK